MFANGVEYDWKAGNADRHFEKHKVRFESVANFEWNSALVQEDERVRYTERRYIAAGMIDGRLHVLVFTQIGKVVWVISLRKANARERKRYEKATAGSP